MRPEPDQSRRAAVASLPSLLAISAAFFLPFVKGCEQMVSPIGFLAEAAHRPAAVLWVAPRFFVAMLLALLTLVALLRRRAPDRASEGVAFAGLAASLGAMGVDWWLLFSEHGGGTAALIWTGGLGVATALGIWLLVTAWRSRGWARWERLIAAHAALSSPLCGFVFNASSFHAIGIGGYCYLVCIGILLGLFALSRRRVTAATVF